MMMKKNIFLNTRILFIWFLVFTLNGLIRAQAQDNAAAPELLRVYFDCGYHVIGSEKELIASAKARIGENNKIRPVENLEVLFYYRSDTGDIYLGSAVSNREGLAKFRLEERFKINSNETGEINYMARFNGNDKFKKASSDISIEEVALKIAFEEIDSVKFIMANAFRKGVDSQNENLSEVNVKFYVPGSFSLLKIGEGEFEDGIAKVKFPITMPGDSLGNLIIIAKIEDNEEFGIVEARAVKNWGAKREINIQEKRRGLGDTDAPLWMVYTLIVLLSTVWIHYLYVFVVINKIKKEGINASAS